MLLVRRWFYQQRRKEWIVNQLVPVTIKLCVKGGINEVREKLHFRLGIGKN